MYLFSLIWHRTTLVIYVILNLKLLNRIIPKKYKRTHTHTQKMRKKNPLNILSVFTEFVWQNRLSGVGSERVSWSWLWPRTLKLMVYGDSGWDNRSIKRFNKINGNEEIRSIRNGQKKRKFTEVFKRQKKIFKTSWNKNFLKYPRNKKMTFALP